MTRGSQPPWAVAILLTGVGLALRVAAARQSLYGDELYTYRAVVHEGLGSVLSTVRDTEDTPPLFFVLAWAGAKLGDPATTVRLPSLLLGTAAVPLTYLLGRRTVGQAAAIGGAALLALSPFAVFYASEARAYSTAMALVLVAALALLGAVERAGRWSWLGYWAAATAALYTHFTALLPLAALACWSLWRLRGRVTRPLVAHACVAAAFVPWLVLRTHADVGSIAALYPFTGSTAGRSLLQAAVGAPFAPLGEVPGTAGWILIGVGAGLAVGAAMLGTSARAAFGSRDLAYGPRDLGPVAGLALAAPLGVLAYSALESSILAPRNLAVSLPGTLLLAAALITRAAGSRHALGLAALVTLAAALAFGSIELLSPEHRRPPWREAARYIDRAGPAGAPVAQVQPLPFHDAYGRQPLRLSLQVYLRHPERVDEVDLGRLPEWARRLPPGRPFFVSLGQITGVRGLPAPPRLGPGIRLTATRGFEGFAPVAVFRYLRE